MTVDIITLFPDMFAGPFDESMIKRAREKGLVTITFHNLRKWAIDERGTVDDRPYGGGPGMLLRPEPLFDAVKEIKANRSKELKQYNAKTILLDAGGRKYTQQTAQEFSQLDHLILICGHYEGVDYRVHEHLANDIISIGDYVLTGGEIPAMVVIDSVVRLLPEVLHKEEATSLESFQPSSLLEYPQYTRPEKFNDYVVPEILLKGHHGQIDTWRKEQSLKRTRSNRSDLLT